MGLQVNPVIVGPVFLPGHSSGATVVQGLAGKLEECKM